MSLKTLGWAALFSLGLWAIGTLIVFAVYRAVQ